MSTATQEKSYTQCATQFFEDNKESFITGFATAMKTGIESGEKDYKNGAFMSLEESKKIVYKELFNK